MPGAVARARVHTRSRRRGRSLPRVLPHTSALEFASLFAEALRLPRPHPAIRRNAAPPSARPRLGARAKALVRAATAEDARLVAWVEDNAARLLARARARLAIMATPG